MSNGSSARCSAIGYSEKGERNFCKGEKDFVNV